MLIWGQHLGVFTHFKLQLHNLARFSIGIDHKNKTGKQLCEMDSLMSAGLCLSKILQKHFQLCG